MKNPERSLEDLTVAQLRSIAKRNRVVLKTGMHKRNIINRLVGMVPRKTLVRETREIREMSK